MSLLVLGGTGDAREIADQLHRLGIDFIYSIAGIVRIPEMPYPLISGGFTQYGGLSAYICQQSITGILDATHPFAVNMSAKAIGVAKEFNLPYWLFNRPAWQPTDTDNWVCFDEMATLFDSIKLIKTTSTIFLSVGQVPNALLNRLSWVNKIILRTAVKPTEALPDNVYWIKSIGPFSLKDEKALLLKYQVDILVTKNSGGNATEAKIIASRELEISVFILNRPHLKTSNKTMNEFTKINHVVATCKQYYLKETK